MTFGCKIFDASGNEVFNLADRLGRLLGGYNAMQPTFEHYMTGTYVTTSWTITDNRLRTGTPFYTLRSTDSAYVWDFKPFYPAVSFYDNTMTWVWDNPVIPPGQYNAGSWQGKNCSIFYGVF